MLKNNRKELNNSEVETNLSCWGPEELTLKREAKQKHQAKFAQIRETWFEKNKYFYDKIKKLLCFIIQPGKKVLNIQCDTGYLLSSVSPSKGVGVDISQEMVDIAKSRHPNLEFYQQYPEDLDLKEKFDYILFNNLSNTVDILSSFKRVMKHCDPHTRLIIYDYNHLWQPIFELAEKLGLRMPMPEQNWFTIHDIENLLTLAGFDCFRIYREILFPKKIPFISEFINRFLAQLPLINRLCMINLLVARPLLKKQAMNKTNVSIIVPCKNEEGNIESAVSRIPEMGKCTEIIFCDDKSTDGTANKIREMQRKFPDKDIRLVDGPGICKAENVWVGFDAAKGDVLIILDADLTVMPEELPYFVETIVEGKGEFINGTRLIYPMQKGAMKLSNIAGNKGFSVLFSFLLGQNITDTLCGTKVIWKSDWEKIKSYKGFWGINDRWGDYDLLFGAAKLHLKIIEIPVHYQERMHGTTKMVRVFHNGLIMLRMCLAAFVKLKARF